MGFDAGFNMGRQIGQQRIENERQAKLDARQAELDKRADAEYNERESAWKGYRDNAPVAPVRIDPAQAAQPTNFQVNTAGLVANPPGYRPQAGTFGDGSDTSPYNMPSSAGGGVMPMEAQGLPQPKQDYVREKSQYDRSLNNRNRDLALGLRDRAGLAAADAQEQVLNRQDIANDVARLSKEELGKFAAGANNSGIPVIYLGKDKNGYMVQMTEADGEPGKKFTLNESEMRQFAMASKLAEAGYGTDAMAYLSAAHKELGAHIGTWNSTTMAAGTLNNTTVRQGNEDANDAARTAALRGYYSTKEPKQLAPEMVKKLNDMAVALSKETDPVKRQRMMQDYRAQESAAMSSIGKVVGLPESKTSFDMPFKDFMETFGEQVVAQKDGKTVLLKDLPIQQIRSEFMKFRDGNDSGSQLDPRGIAAILGGDPSAAATKPPAKGGLRLNYGPIGDAVKAGGARIGEFVDTLPRGDYPGREADEKAAFGL